MLIRRFVLFMFCLCACSGENIDLEGPPAPDLSEWLQANPTVMAAIRLESANFGPSYKGNGTLVEVAYENWTDADKEALNLAFQRAWVNLYVQRDLNQTGSEEFTMPMSCENCAAAAAANSTDIPLQYTREDIGKRAYFAYLAQTLAVELGSLVNWSIAGLSASDLFDHLNSRSLFHRRGLGSDQFQVGDGPGNSISADRELGNGSPATPIYAYNFLIKNNILATSEEQTILNLLQWFRENGVHFEGAYSWAEALRHWGVSAETPAHAVMDGTVRPGESNRRHWTAGCHGTNAFLKSVLKTVNIPVRLLLICGHNVAHFPTIGRYMDHGDNPYNANVRNQPEKNISGVLIDQATFVARFGATPHGMAPGSPACPFIGQATDDF